MTRRRGYSLIEMLLVMSALSVVFAICVSVLFTLMKVDRSGRAQVLQAVTRERLARQFREDARAATKGREIPVKNDNVGGIELRLPEGRVVEYRRTGTDVERIERGPNVPTHRDLYRLYSRKRADVTAKGQDGPTWAVLVVPPDDEPGRLVPAREFRVEALVGKDHRPPSRKEEER